MTSVVIPVLNGESILDTTAPSVLESSGVDEWVWVDDGSSDGTASALDALVAGVPNARVVHLPTNRGRSAARNAGIAASAGDVVVFFDVDVEPSGDAARQLVEAASQEGAIASVARVRPVLDAPHDPYQDYLAHYPRGPSAGLPAGAVLDWRFFLGGACAIRRDALVEAGSFPEDVGYGEDFALGCELARHAPDGLRLADTSVRLHDVGRLEDALHRADAFGQGLEAMSPGCRRHALGSIAAIPGAGRAAGFGAWVLRGAVRRLGPGDARRRAVRYLLGARILSATPRA
ncbi:MAG: glycosyltransferase family 2 protein [Parerythrobacter sp.]